jgi:sarcosine oxidase gamma subunit
MAEIRLKARSAFAALLKPGRHGTEGGAAGVSLSERAGLALCVISAGAGKASEVATKMNSVTGLDLPVGSKRVSKNGFALIGTAPGQWLAVAESREARALSMLGVALKGDATVVDLSDGKAVLRISGPRARDTLARPASKCFQAGERGDDARRADRLRDLAGRRDADLRPRRADELRRELLVLAHRVGGRI